MSPGKISTCHHVPYRDGQAQMGRVGQVSPPKKSRRLLSDRRLHTVRPTSSVGINPVPLCADFVTDRTEQLLQLPLIQTGTGTGDRWGGESQWGIPRLRVVHYLGVDAAPLLHTVGPFTQLNSVRRNTKQSQCGLPLGVPPDQSAPVGVVRTLLPGTTPSTLRTTASTLCTTPPSPRTGARPGEQAGQGGQAGGRVHHPHGFLLRPDLLGAHGHHLRRLRFPGVAPTACWG